VAIADALNELGRLAPVDMGEWGNLLGRVIRSVEINKDHLVVVPLVGERTSTPR